MKELIKKVVASNEEALNSLESFVETAKKLGYAQEKIDKALDQLDGFPLDDEDMEEITGGFLIAHAPMENFTKQKN